MAVNAHTPLRDVALTKLTFLPHWMNLKEKVLQHQQIDKRCRQAVAVSRLGCVSGITDIICDLLDREYNVKRVIWNCVCRYYLWEYLVYSQNPKCFPLGLFKEMRSVVAAEVEDPLFTANVVFCNYMEGFASLRMTRVARDDPDCIVHYMVTYGRAPGSLRRQLHIEVMQHQIHIHSRYYNETPTWDLPDPAYYGLCVWDGKDPQMELSEALLRRDMIGMETDKPRPDWVGQTHLRQYGIRRKRRKEWRRHSHKKQRME